MKQTKTTPQWISAVKERLTKHAEKVEFNDFEHTYTLKSTQKALTSISVMLNSFKSGIDNVPADILEKSKIRGLVVHKVAEWIFQQDHSNFKEEDVYKYAETIDAYDALEHSYLIDNLMKHFIILQNMGYDIFITEQLLYDAKAGIAGTADMIAFKKVLPDLILVQVMDWKTGNIRPENYAQVSLYQAMLKNALNGLKLDEETKFVIGGIVVSLKDLSNSTELTIQPTQKKEDTTCQENLN